MQVDDVIRRVQRTFGDENESQIRITDIIDWINAAQRDIARRTEVMQGNQSYPTQTNNDYVLPDDFLRAARVEYDGKKINMTTLDNLDMWGTDDPVHVTGDATPFWYIWGNLLHLYPNPNNTSHTVKLFYTKLPVLVTQGPDELSVPEHMHEDVVNYCMMKARELNEDFDERNALQAVHTQRMAESSEIAFDPTTNSYIAVRDWEADYHW